MKILVSAYACRPGMGSEPAVGWNWVLEYSKLCEIVVMTNYTNEPYILNYLKEHKGELDSVRFMFIKPNAKVELWYKEWERMERLYYMIWQRIALKVAREIVEKEHFDYVQHVTYVSCVMPTYMYKLGIPLIYGPVSGGEEIPKVIHYPFSTKEKIIEFARTTTQKIAKLSGNFHFCCKTAKYIVAVTNETKNMVPREYQSKVIVSQAIGLSDDVIIKTQKVQNEGKKKFLIVGRMLSWKGFKIGIEAFVDALNQGVDAQLTVLGTGNDNLRDELKTICGPYADKQIIFVDSVKYTEMQSFYDQHDVLINCSLRDSGCLAVMEAMGRGLPIICIDTGGPRVNTELGGAVKIPVRSYDLVKQDITAAIKKLTEENELRNSLSEKSREIAKNEFEYAAKMEDFYKKYIVGELK